MTPFQIAIDGPVGAGKTTIARKVAEELGFTYIDTGAMYRVTALAAKQQAIDWHDETKVSELVSTLKIDLNKSKILLNYQDVSNAIRTPEVAEGASIVSQYAKVRKILVHLQQTIAQNSNVVMEGRDIGSRVLPNAQIKVFLTADLEVRVNREVDYLKRLNQTVDLNTVRQAIITRDQREMTRSIDPLKPTKDAWILDSTNLSIEQVVDQITQKVHQRVI